MNDSYDHNFDLLAWKCCTTHRYLMGCIWTKYEARNHLGERETTERTKPVAGTQTDKHVKAITNVLNIIIFAIL